MPSVVIIGASLSGSSLALRLARAGVDVCLLDMAKFPRAKACGEGLSAQGVACLERLALHKTLAALPCAPFYSYTVSSQAGPIVIPALPGGAAGAVSIGIERTHLDGAVLGAALNEPLVRGRFGRAVRRVSRAGSKFYAHLPGETIEAHAVVLACGGSSGLLRQKPLRSLRSGRTWKAEGRFHESFQSVHIHLLRGYEVFFTRVGLRRLNISVLSDSAAVLQSVQAADLLRLADEHCRFTGVMADNPIGSGMLTSFQRPAVQDGLLLVGDACEVLDPIGGMGMTHALLSAELAAESVLSWLGGKQTMASAFAEYASRRKHAAAPLRRLTRAIYFTLKQAPKPVRSGILRATAIVGSVRASADTADRRSESSRQPADR